MTRGIGRMAGIASSGKCFIPLLLSRMIHHVRSFIGDAGRSLAWRASIHLHPKICQLYKDIPLFPRPIANASFQFKLHCTVVQPACLHKVPLIPPLTRLTFFFSTILLYQLSQIQFLAPVIVWTWRRTLQVNQWLMLTRWQDLVDRTELHSRQGTLIAMVET